MSATGYGMPGYGCGGMFLPFSICDDVNPSIGITSPRGSCMPDGSDEMEVVAPSDGRSVSGMFSAPMRERLRGTLATAYGVPGYGGGGMSLLFSVCGDVNPSIGIASPSGCCMPEGPPIPESS